MARLRGVPLQRLRVDGFSRHSPIWGTHERGVRGEYPAPCYAWATRRSDVGSPASLNAHLLVRTSYVRVFQYFLRRSIAAIAALAIHSVCLHVLGSLAALERVEGADVPQK